MANEKRLIDVEQAKRATYEEIFWSESEQAVVRNFLAKLPKVDAVEVVHGRWEERIVDHEIPYYTVVDCSLCGCSGERWHTYCPNCGAKMDGDGNA